MELTMQTTEDGKVVLGLVLDQETADTITEYLFDGYCVLCGTGVNLYTKICCQCLDDEITAHRGTHIHESFRTS